MVNQKQNNGSFPYQFQKQKLSLKRSTFLNEEEESDMQNVDEFNEQEEYSSARCVKIGRLAANRRILKALPITKESFMNWNNKQSMLKSFATSHEVSFVSNKPTERIETNTINAENVNPSQILRYEQQVFNMEVMNEPKRKMPRDYVINELEESSNGFSSAFKEESSWVFEEYDAAHSFHREASRASNKSKPSKLQQMRQEKLHNCNKVHDYKFINTQKPKDSIIISRNNGDDALVMRETMDYIENFSGEEYLSTPEKSKSILVSILFSLF